MKSAVSDISHVLLLKVPSWSPGKLDTGSPCASVLLSSLTRPSLQPTIFLILRTALQIVSKVRDRSGLSISPGRLRTQQSCPSSFVFPPRVTQLYPRAPLQALPSIFPPAKHVTGSNKSLLSVSPLCLHFLCTSEDTVGTLS